MKTLTFLITICLIVVFAMSACGISARSLKRDPGYADIVYPSLWEADEEVSFSLGPALLRIAAWFIDDEEEEFAGLIKNIKGIHLRVYNVTQNSTLLQGYMNASAEQLDGLGWNRLVTVNEADEQAVVLVKMNDETVDGVALMAVDAREAVFINVIGNIEPAALQPLLSEIYSDVPAVNAINL